MKKKFAMLMVVMLAAAFAGGCSDTTGQQAESGREGTVSENASEDKHKNDDAQDTKPATEKAVAAYTEVKGFTLCDEDNIALYQGSFVDMAPGYDVICLTEDDMLVSFDEENATVTVPGALRFVESCGSGVIVESENGLCMSYDDLSGSITMTYEGFTMAEGSYYEVDKLNRDGVEYIVNNGERLVGYKYNDSMELLASEIPVVLDASSGMGLDENDSIYAGGFCTTEGIRYYLFDTNNSVWEAYTAGYLMKMKYRDGQMQITTYARPALTECRMICCCPDYDELLIARTNDDTNLYLMKTEKMPYEEIGVLPLPDGMKITDIENFIKDSDDNVFITKSREVYSINKNGDTYDIVAQPELSQLLQEGKIVKIVGDGYNTLFLMDDGCVYERSRF